MQRILSQYNAKEVSYTFDSASVFAPNSSKLLAMSNWFFLAVMCRGVYPFLAAACGDAFCEQEYWKQYYLKNREIIIERAQKWNQNHKGAKRLIDERAKLKNNELEWLTIK